jgi:non-specific serine/threonine protein kinase
VSVRAISDLERGVNQRARPATLRQLVEALNLGAADAAQLRSADGAPLVNDYSPGDPPAGRHNLPAELSSFVGREHELDQLREKLRSTRLITLTGVGGIGKTRLALRLAAENASIYADGVWLVELASIADAALVAQTVASALGIHEQPGRSAVASIADVLAVRELLLLLDNCEHVVPACADLAHRVLSASPRACILTTSREPLGVPGECVWPVSTLSIPSELDPPTYAFEQFESTRLFVERASAVAPRVALTAADMRTVGNVCRQLDGIPLGIELAAACVPSMAIGDIAAHLDRRFDLLTHGSRTAPERQQTLRAMVDWSYELLSDLERQLLLRSSVFAGGWTLEAARSVCAGDGISPHSVLDLLARLVQKSLVIQTPVDGTSRLRLLETIRAYAEERLSSADPAFEDELRRHHAEHYLGVAEQWMAAAVRGPDRKAWLDRLDREHANFRQALRWVVDGHTNEETRLRWAAALGTFWFFRGHFMEGRAWQTALGVAPEAAGTTRNWARALIGVAMVTVHGEVDLPFAEACASKALEIGRAVGDDLTVNRARNNLGTILRLRGEYDRAVLVLEDAVVDTQRTHDRGRESLSSQALCLSRLARGDYASAQAAGKTSLRLATELEDVYVQGLAYGALGDVARELNDMLLARDHYAASLRCATQVDFGQQRSSALLGLAYVSQVSGDVQQASVLFRDSLAIAHKLGLLIELLEALEGCSCSAVSRGYPTESLMLAGAAAAQRDAIGAPLSRTSYKQLQSFQDSARRMLGDSESLAAVERGRQMSRESAVALGLEVTRTSMRSHELSW